MKLRTIGFAILLAGAFSAPAKANLIDVNFTIIGNPSDEGFNYEYTVLPGNVTGEIIGLPYNGTGSASNILITSVSGGLGISPTPSSPYSLLANRAF